MDQDPGPPSEWWIWLLAAMGVVSILAVPAVVGWLMR